MERPRTYVRCGIRKKRVCRRSYSLWRAVDHEGKVLKVFASKRRNHKAVLKFLHRAMKRYGNPKVIVTDRLASYGAAFRTLGIKQRQRCGCWLNNRVKKSHQPFRRRERAMPKFRNIKTLQKFASSHAAVHNHFNLERHLLSRIGRVVATGCVKHCADAPIRGPLSWV